MDCAEEVSLLRRALSQKSGIRDLHFDVITSRMSVEFDSTLIGSPDIQLAVRGLGMRAHPWRNDEPLAPTLWAAHSRSFLALVSGVCLLAALIWQGISGGHLLESLLAHSHTRGHEIGWALRVMFVTAIVSGSYASLPKAWASLRNLRPDMNLLVLFSVIGAMVLEEWGEAATLSFLFSLAGILESWSMGRARDAIAKFFQVTPQTATVIQAHGDHVHESRVPVAEVPTGALVRIKPGERIPVDGTIERGMSFVNQALITGESVPISKRPGDPVYAGTLNEDGSLEVRTVKPPSDTLLARMTRMVSDSQTRRAPSEQLVERFSRYYTPIVFGLALLVMVVPPLAGRGTWNEWFYQGMVILLISCPCALVISTPVSVAAALAAAARHGVLIKGGAFLEGAARIRAIAFDKTGVLTSGEPRVESLIPLNGRPEQEVLQNLASLELGSEHPIARAVLAYAAERGVHPTSPVEFHSLLGLGAEADIQGQRFWAGSTRMLRERGMETEAVSQALQQLADSAHTVVVCGAGETAWALLTISDPPRTEARPLLSSLRSLGVRHQVILSGDNQATSRSVAAQVGADEVFAELLPEDKAAVVEELRTRYGSVAMVGDGVNDAQALSAANLGVSFGSKHADVAMETADAVLLSNDLNMVRFLLEHARQTVLIIQQNMALALAMKALFLALAMAGKATLWMAVAADMGATFLVTFNGLRLLAARPKGLRPTGIQ